MEWQEAIHMTISSLAFMPPTLSHKEYKGSFYFPTNMCMRGMILPLVKMEWQQDIRTGASLLISGTLQSGNGVQMAALVKLWTTIDEQMCVCYGQIWKEVLHFQNTCGNRSSALHIFHIHKQRLGMSIFWQLYCFVLYYTAGDSGLSAGLISNADSFITKKLDTLQVISHTCVDQCNRL